MGTKFTTIYDRFLGKITDDMYMELTPQDTVKDLQRLLIDAIPGFEFPRISLYDYVLTTEQVDVSTLEDNDFIIGTVWNELDDLSDTAVNKVIVEKSTFNATLSSEEVEILAILMMIGWLQRQLTSVENIRMKYSGSDFKMTSQANHLSKLQSLLGECQRQSHHLQRLYKRRELSSITGTYNSSWSWFGQNGTIH